MTAASVSSGWSAGAGKDDSVDGVVLASVSLSGARPVRLRIDARGEPL